MTKEDVVRFTLVEFDFRAMSLLNKEHNWAINELIEELKSRVQAPETDESETQR